MHRPSIRLRPDEDEFARAVRRVEGRERTVRRVRLLGYVHLAMGALGILGGLVAFLAIAPWGFISGDATAAVVTGGIGTVVAGVMFVMSLPGVLTGIGLLQEKSWARTLGTVVGALLLFSVPIGTIVGGATLYILLQEDTGLLLEGRL